LVAETILDSKKDPSSEAGKLINDTHKLNSYTDQFIKSRQNTTAPASQPEE